jgi:hypothetical protein
MKRKVKKLALTNEEIDCLLYAILCEKHDACDRKNRTFSKKFVGNLREKLRAMYNI